MTDSNCVFCEILRKSDNIIWKGDYLFAKYDIHPVSPGHAIIMPIRHVADLKDLNENEWIEYKTAIKEVVNIITSTNFSETYSNLLNGPDSSSEITRWYLNTILKNPNINNKPAAFNHGINDGRVAGRTVDHLHWQIIPRYTGDSDDPRGGVRFIIPEMANYKIAR